jgi:BESS motif
LSNKSFDFNSYGTLDSSFQKGNNKQNTEIVNDTSNYGILVESLDQEESTNDGEFNEAGSAVFVQDEPIDEEEVHYEPEQIETYDTPLSNSDLPTSLGFHTSDDNEKFLQSCLPTLRRLNTRKNMLARLRIQQVLFDIEFNENC